MDPIIVPSTTPIIPSPVTTNPITPPTTIEYAGFWRRVGASIVDSSILTFFIIIITVLVNFIDPAAIKVAISLILPITVFIVFPWMESSVWQATIGKKLFGLTVTNLNGGRISFWRALGRNIAKTLSILILMVGYMMAGFTEKKQGLHDMIAGTLVVKTSKAKTGPILLVIFGPMILSIVMFFLFAATLFSGLLFGGLTMDNSTTTVQDTTTLPTDASSNDTTVSVPAGIAPADQVFAGTYDLANKNGEINVYPVPNTPAGQDNGILFYLTASRGAPDYDSGELYGEAYEYKPGQFSYYDKIDDQDICALNLAFSGNVLTVTSSNNDNGAGCGFGYGVGSDGTYAKKAGPAPQSFTTNGGNTLYFKDTPVGTPLD